MAARDEGAGMRHRLFPSMALRRRRRRHHDAVDRSERPGLVVALPNNCSLKSLTAILYRHPANTGDIFF